MPPVPPLPPSPPSSPPLPPYTPLPWNATLPAGLVTAILLLVALVPIVAALAAWPCCFLCRGVLVSPATGKRTRRARGAQSLNSVEVQLDAPSAPAEGGEDCREDAGSLGQGLDVASVLQDRPAALLGVSVQRVAAALVRGEPTDVVMRALYAGHRFLVRATDPTGTRKLGRLAIISYRIAMDESTFTVSEAVFRDAIATAQHEGIDLLWLDCCAPRTAARGRRGCPSEGMPPWSRG